MSVSMAKNNPAIRHTVALAVLIVSGCVRGDAVPSDAMSSSRVSQAAESSIADPDPRSVESNPAAGMTLEHHLASSGLSGIVAGSRYDVIVATVDSVSKHQATNGNPPLVGLTIHEVLSGDPNRN